MWLRKSLLILKKLCIIGVSNQNMFVTTGGFCYSIDLNCSVGNGIASSFALEANHAIPVRTILVGHPRGVVFIANVFIRTVSNKIVMTY